MSPVSVGPTLVTLVAPLLDASTAIWYHHPWEYWEEVPWVTRRVLQKQQVLDLGTGEVLDVVALLPSRKDRDFGKFYALFANKLLEELGLMNGEGKLLLYFLARVVDEPLQSEGWVRLDYEEAARTLGVGQRTLDRYLAKLKKRGFLEQDRPRSYLWRIRPDLVYRGSLVKYFDDRVDRFLKQIRGRVANDNVADGR